MLMITWAASYQQQTLVHLGGQNPTLDVQLHGVFYAIIQVLLVFLLNCPGLLPHMWISPLCMDMVPCSCEQFVPSDPLNSESCFQVSPINVNVELIIVRSRVVRRESSTYFATSTSYYYRLQQQSHVRRSGPRCTPSCSAL